MPATRRHTPQTHVNIQARLRAHFGVGSLLATSVPTPPIMRTIGYEPNAQTWSALIKALREVIEFNASYYEGRVVGLEVTPPCCVTVHILDYAPAFSQQ